MQSLGADHRIEDGLREENGMSECEEAVLAAAIAWVEAILGRLAPMKGIDG